MRLSNLLSILEIMQNRGWKLKIRRSIKIDFRESCIQRPQSIGLRICWNLAMPKLMGGGLLGAHILPLLLSIWKRCSRKWSLPI